MRRANSAVMLIFLAISTLFAQEEHASGRWICGTPVLKNLYKDMVPNEPTFEQLYFLGEIDSQGKVIEDGIGDRHTFHVWNFAERKYYTIEAECIAVGANCYVYLDINRLPFNDRTLLNAIVDTFDNYIYTRVRSTFGEDTRLIDLLDRKVTILIFDIISRPGYTTMGYFNRNDIGGYNPFVSNRRRLIYINYAMITSFSERSDVFETMAHEFQHLVHYYQDPDEEDWIDEGCAELAIYRVFNRLGTVEREHLGPFYKDQDVLLTLDYWGDDNPLYKIANYGASFLFIAYLWDHYGGDAFIKELVAEDRNGIDGVNAVFENMGMIERFDDVFFKWAIANLADPYTSNPEYTYSMLDTRIEPKKFEVSIGSPKDIPEKIREYSCGYYKLTGHGEVTAPITLALQTDSKTRTSPYAILHRNNGLDDEGSINLIPFGTNQFGDIDFANIGASDNLLIALPRAGNDGTGKFTLGLYQTDDAVEYVRINPQWVVEDGTYQIEVEVKNIGPNVLNNLWLGCDIHKKGETTPIEETYTPINTTAGLNFSNQGMSLQPGETRVFTSTYTFDNSSMGHDYLPGNYEYHFRVYKDGYPGSGTETEITNVASFPLRIVEKQTQNCDVFLVLDRSGSMSANDMEGGRTRYSAAKSAAKLFLSPLFIEPFDAYGIVTFSSSASTDLPLTVVDDLHNSEWFSAQIDGLPGTGGLTAIGLAIQSAYNGLRSSSSENDKAILLLSDGEHNEGTHPNTVIADSPELRDRVWSIYTVALASESGRSTLKEISNLTGGSSQYTRSAADLLSFFSAVALELHGGSILSRVLDYLNPLIELLIPLVNFNSDKNLILVMFANSSSRRVGKSDHFLECPAIVELIDPEGNSYLPEDFSGADTAIVGEGYIGFRINRQMKGTWYIRISDPDGSISSMPISVLSGSIYPDRKINIGNLSPVYNLGDEITFQIDAKQLSSQGGYVPFNEIEFTNKICTPLGDTINIDVFDDGFHGDGDPGDGIFACNPFLPSREGIYKLIVEYQGVKENSSTCNGVLTQDFIVGSRSGIYVDPNSLTPKPGEELATQSVEVSARFIGPLDRLDLSTLELKYDYENVALDSSNFDYSTGMLTVEIPNVANGSHWISLRYADVDGKWYSPVEWSFESYASDVMLSDVYAYPNPWRGEGVVHFHYVLAENSNIKITIFDVSQEVVISLVSESKLAGIHDEDMWDGKNEKGDIVANGVYFYLIEYGDGERFVGKIAVLR